MLYQLSPPTPSFNMYYYPNDQLYYVYGYSEKAETHKEPAQLVFELFISSAFEAFSEWNKTVEVYAVENFI